MNSIEGCVDYQRREFCKDISCPIQLQLNELEGNEEEYQKVRAQCKTDCIHSTYEFHHWLIKQGYLIVKPA